MAKNLFGNDDSDEPKKITIYTIKLDDDQMDKLNHICDQKIMDKYEVDYAKFAYRSKYDKINLVGYKSGKIVVQGKGTEEFVQNVIEAEVTGVPELGYEDIIHPEWYEAHAGLDEAGKGDLFGPLVSACVIVTKTDEIKKWREAGIRDSKKIADGTALKLEKIIKKTPGVVVKTTFCNMNKYNQLMSKPNSNLNLLLAWHHAKSLENALKVKRVPWGLLDQFSKQPLVQRYFKDDKFELRMQTKAEADPVVAAASIIARAEFLRQMKFLSDKFGDKLLKGASAAVKKQAGQIIKKLGPESLGDFAKLHFKTAREALNSN